jgi:putative membrane protein
MGHTLNAIIAAAALAVMPLPAFAADGPSDAQIAHIAYTAGNLDIVAAKQALAKSNSEAVREFASAMVRDHEAVNVKALELVKALNVTPDDNPTSQALSKSAAETYARLDALDGAAFDQAYAENEIAFHKAVNAALESTLIPSATNDQLKSLLETGLTLFREHQTHAEHLASELN